MRLAEPELVGPLPLGRGSRLPHNPRMWAVELVRAVTVMREAAKAAEAATDNSDEAARDLADLNKLEAKFPTSFFLPSAPFADMARIEKPRRHAGSRVRHEAALPTQRGGRRALAPRRAPRPTVVLVAVAVV